MSTRYASTADNVLASPLAWPTKTREIDPLDAVEWYGKTLRWLIDNGLGYAAWSILYEHERREKRLRCEARDA